MNSVSRMVHPLLVAATSGLLLTSARAVCPSLSQIYISQCQYACFPSCQAANRGDLVGAVSSCFHDTWGYGGFGLFGDADVDLWVCDTPCGCSEDNPDTSENNCKGCEKVTRLRLNGGETCSGSFGCLNFLGPTDRCCPGAMEAVGYQCLQQLW